MRKETPRAPGVAAAPELDSTREPSIVSLITRKLEEDIVRVHDMHPADELVDRHLGLALMHVRKARGQRIIPPNLYAKKK